MPDDAHESVRKKVEAIFTELVGERARILEGGKIPSGTTSRITQALSNPKATKEQILRADQIAFHLTDWNSDAAFIIALHLFPEQFTPEEIEAAVDMFLIHVPNHVVAAARLYGHPPKDIFNLGDDGLA
jgi:hypothetical protein